MRSALLLTAALAAGACATELNKRVYVTDWTTVVITKTVTADIAPAQTEAPAKPADKAAAVPEVKNVQADKAAVVPVVKNFQADKAAVVPKVNNVHADSSSGSDSLLGALLGGGDSNNNVGATTNSNQDTTNHDKPAPAPTVIEDKPAPKPTTITEAVAPTTMPTSTTTEDKPAPKPTTITEAVAPTTMTTSTTTAGSSAPTTNSYQAAVLYNHNIHRSNHSAPSVDWDADLEQTAHTLAARCVYEHDTSIGGGGYGQNIGYGVQADQIGGMITNLMYNDEMEYYADLYGEANPSMADFAKWGHFSQIVWKDTQKVGCSTVVCSNLQNVDSSDAIPFTVCNYSPPGNYAGEYNTNVLKPLGDKTFVAE